MKRIEIVTYTNGFIAYQRDDSTVVIDSYDEPRTGIARRIKAEGLPLVGQDVRVLAAIPTENVTLLQWELQEHQFYAEFGLLSYSINKWNNALNFYLYGLYITSTACANLEEAQYKAEQHAQKWRSFAGKMEGMK